MLCRSLFNKMSTNTENVQVSNNDNVRHKILKQMLIIILSQIKMERYKLSWGVSSLISFSRKAKSKYARENIRLGNAICWLQESRPRRSLVNLNL